MLSGVGDAATGALWTAHEDVRGRVVVTDSLTFCDARVGPRDVVVTGSFAGTLAFGLALERGVRGLVAHAAGVGRDRAGIAGLALAEGLGIPAAAVDTMSARLGEGWSVYAEGVVACANAPAAALGVHPGVTAREAAQRLLGAPEGRPWPGAGPVDREARVLLETPRGRVVAVGSVSFAGPHHRGDVLCAGSHGGRVNARPVLEVRPRGVLFNDGGLARDRSGVSGLPLLDAAGIPAAAVGTLSARIGDPVSTFETGVISVANAVAVRYGVRPGQEAREAARLLLERGG